jgi:hypothetical protein
MPESPRAVFQTAGVGYHETPPSSRAVLLHRAPAAPGRGARRRFNERNPNPDIPLTGAQGERNRNDPQGC